MTQPSEYPVGQVPADAAVYGPYGPKAPSCTNWDAYELPAMWASIEHEDPAAADGQLDSWRRVGEALDSLRERLPSARQELAEGWPPEKNAAAAAFIADIDELEQSLRTASANAYSTERGLYGVITAIAQAKSELKPVMDHYLRTSTDLIPHWMDGGEDDLNRQAREIMARHEAAVLDHGSQIQPMPEWHEPIDVWGTDAGAEKVEAGRDVVPPVERTPIPHTPGMNPLMPAGETWSSTSGPLLAGGHTVSEAGGAPGVVLPSIDGNSHAVGIPPSGAGAGPVSGRWPGVRAEARRTSASVLDGVRVIGGSAEPSQMGEPRRPISPSGSTGLRGARSSLVEASTSALRTGAPSPGVPLSGSGGRRQQTDDDVSIYRSGDIQWEVPKGVPGLIEVEPEPGPHDAGAGWVIRG